MSALRLVAATLSLALAAISSARSSEPTRDCEGCPQMVQVPAGSFLMGQDPEESIKELQESKRSNNVSLSREDAIALLNDWRSGYAGDDSPQHRVALKRFWMSASEITRDQFGAFVQATGYNATGPCQI